MKDTMNLLDTTLREIMTEDFIYVKANTLMQEVIDIFDNNPFHHLPVLDHDGKPIGMISKSDYNKLLHHFTLFNYKEAEVNNERFFRSLIAEDVMNKKPITIKVGTNLREILKMFMVNRFHSLIVVEEDRCIGIVTPFDFLELLMEQENITDHV